MFLFVKHVLYIVYYLLTATNESLDTEIRETMNNLDKLRNSLYESFRPQIKILEELQIDDNNSIVRNVPTLVATKKVTQIRVPPTILSQDNQLEIVAEIEPPSNQKIIVHNLPAALGPLIKPTPEPDSNVYITKSPIMPWIRAKVCIQFLLYL